MEALSDGLLTETNPFIQIDVSRHANPPSLAGKQAVYLLFSQSPDEDPKSRGFSEKVRPMQLLGKKRLKSFVKLNFLTCTEQFFFSFVLTFRH